MVCFSSIEVLEAKDNKIDDLIELEMCTTLKCLNLKNNLIKEEDNIFFVSSLTHLKYLNLNGNPIQENEKYKNLLNENLNFIEKKDVEDFESPKMNSKNINNFNLSSKEIENSLDITNGSKETNSQSNGNLSLRPPSSITLTDFYKKDKNSYIPFNYKNTILDSNQLTKTTMNWRHNNIETDMNKYNLDSNKKVLQGIKSILSQNRKCLNDISINDDNNELDNSFNTKLEKAVNLKGFSETSRIFSSKVSALNPLKPIISLNKNPNADEKKSIMIKKPVVLKSSLNAQQSNIGGDSLNNNLNISGTTSINDVNLSNTSSSFIKFKKDSQIPLKPIVFKKIDKVANDLNIESNNGLINNEREGNSFFSNSENKIVFKYKPVVIKNPNANDSLVEETNSPKKVFLNPASFKVKAFFKTIKFNF